MGHLFRCIAFALVLANTPAIAVEPVDLLLVLAADVSRSVDSQKFQLQREGYAAAMANPRVVDAIRSGRHGRIGVLFLEWSWFRQPEGRHRLDDHRWTKSGAGLRRPAARGRRGLSLTGLQSVAASMRLSANSRARRSAPTGAQSTFQATERTMRAVTSARLGTRRSPSALQSTVWRFSARRRCPGIPSTPTRAGGLTKYYRDNVIGGPGSFVIEAKDFSSFGQAIIKK
jgi:hypothetical protein